MIHPALIFSNLLYKTKMFYDTLSGVSRSAAVSSITVFITLDNALLQ